MDNNNYGPIKSFSQSQVPTNSGNKIGDSGNIGNSSGNWGTNDDSFSSSSNPISNQISNAQQTDDATSQISEDEISSINQISGTTDSSLDINSLDPLNDDLANTQYSSLNKTDDEKFDALIQHYNTKIKELEQSDRKDFEEKGFADDSHREQFEKAEDFTTSGDLLDDSLTGSDIQSSYDKLFDDAGQPISVIAKDIIVDQVIDEPEQTHSAGTNISSSNDNDSEQTHSTGTNISTSNDNDIGLSDSISSNIYTGNIVNKDIISSDANYDSTNDIATDKSNSDDEENLRILQEFKQYEDQVLQEMNRKMGIKSTTDLSKYSDLGYRGEVQSDKKNDIDAPNIDFSAKDILSANRTLDTNADVIDSSMQINTSNISEGPSDISSKKTVVDPTDYNKLDFSHGSGSMMHDDSSLSNYVNIDDIINDIKSIKIQGATNVAIATFMGLKLFVNQYNREVPLEVFISDVQRAGISIANARPNEPLAKNGVKFIINKLNRETGLINGIDPLPQDSNEIFNKVSEIIQNTDDLSQNSLYQSSSDEIYHVKDLISAKKRVLELCEDYITHIKNAKQKIIEYASPVLKNIKSILTHCHSSTSEKIIINQSKNIAGFKVACTETRPLFQGRITAKNLADAGLDVTFLTDSAAPGFIAGKGSFPIDAVFIGADQMTINGDAINKVGSWSIASAAIAAGKPVYIVTSILKLDLTTAYKPIEIEMRSGKEIWEEAPDGVTVYNPSFELIESKYITGYLTEIGVISPSELTHSAQKTYYWLT